VVSLCRLWVDKKLLSIKEEFVLSIETDKINEDNLSLKLTFSHSHFQPNIFRSSSYPDLGYSYSSFSVLQHWIIYCSTFMELDISFNFRNRMYSYRLLIDYSEEPYYIFTIQKDSFIIDKYSDDVSIKTDLFKVLPKEDDFLDGIVELRQAIFNAFISTPEYHMLKAQLSKSKAEK
jgi:hypothetical protein